MSVLGVLLVVGVTLTLRWGGTAYEPWSPGDGPPAAGRPPLRTAALGYLRGVAIALVGGFWAGALVTGPAVRLVMRLLAATAGDGAQGLLTEAEEVVGNIDLGGTIGLYLFGGIFPGLLSGALYLLVRRWLPAGRLGGLAFGALHLVVARHPARSPAPRQPRLRPRRAGLAGGADLLPGRHLPRHGRRGHRQPLQHPLPAPRRQRQPGGTGARPPAPRPARSPAHPRRLRGLSPHHRTDRHAGRVPPPTDRAGPAERGGGGRGPGRGWPCSPSPSSRGR